MTEDQIREIWHDGYTKDVTTRADLAEMIKEIWRTVVEKAEAIRKGRDVSRIRLQNPETQDEYHIFYSNKEVERIEIKDAYLSIEQEHMIIEDIKCDPINARFKTRMAELDFNGASEMWMRWHTCVHAYIFVNHRRLMVENLKLLDVIDKQGRIIEPIKTIQLSL